MSRLEPPVNPFSDPDAIRLWIDRLRELRETHQEDPVTLALITERIRDAESWLDFRGYGDGADLPARDRP